MFSELICWFICLFVAVYMQMSVSLHNNAPP